jgi:hypothetical protein
MYKIRAILTILTHHHFSEKLSTGSIPGWVHFFLFFYLAPFILYQKPVIDHCPWPSSQFNKWHAQNELLSSSLIVIGAALGSPLAHVMNMKSLVASMVCVGLA